MKTTLILAIGALGLGAAACSHDTAPPPQYATPQTTGGQVYTSPNYNQPNQMDPAAAPTDPGAPVSTWGSKPNSAPAPVRTPDAINAPGPTGDSAGTTAPVPNAVPTAPGGNNGHP